MSARICIYCSMDCKSSDSRPYPNSKSKDRIHNKCLMKKNMSDRKQVGDTKELKSSKQSTSCTMAKLTNDSATTLMERVAKEDYDNKKAVNERKLLKLMKEQALQSEKEAQSSGQFFFDVKAGIAKPHEKKRYLHHRKVCEIAARFDDNGFQEEAAGRAYDHDGKDLNSAQDTDNDSDDEPKSRIQVELRDTSTERLSSNKRKMESENNQDIYKKHLKLRVDDKNPCWFCLSSPKVEKHLILAIGDHCYLTLAKGGLTDEHLLIIPIEHIQSSREENSPEVIEELEQFKKSLIDYFQSQDKGVVFFERNFRSVHWQLQVVPIPIEATDKIGEKIKSVSSFHYKNSNYIDIPAKCSLQDVIPPAVPYFYWQIEPESVRFVTQIQVRGSFFPIQLGRIILADADILNCPYRVDWKSCAMSQEECSVIVKSFKEKYKRFNIT